MDVNLHPSCQRRETLVWDTVTTAGQPAFLASKILRLRIGQRLLEQYFPEIYWGRNGDSQWQAYPAEVVVKAILDQVSAILDQQNKDKLLFHVGTDHLSPAVPIYVAPLGKYIYGLIDNTNPDAFDVYGRCVDISQAPILPPFTHRFSNEIGAVKCLVRDVAEYEGLTYTPRKDIFIHPSLFTTAAGPDITKKCRAGARCHNLDGREVAVAHTLLLSRLVTGFAGLEIDVYSLPAHYFDQSPLSDTQLETFYDIQFGTFRRDQPCAVYGHRLAQHIAHTQEAFTSVANYVEFERHVWAIFNDYDIQDGVLVLSDLAWPDAGIEAIKAEFRQEMELFYG